MNLLYTAHVPPGDGPLPTILALHGWGASAHDLLGLAPVIQGGGGLMLCPQGSVAFEIGQGFLGFGWFELSQVRPPTASDIERAADDVRAFLDGALARYPIDRRKVVVMGFSQGGVIAYDLALRDPDRFAGVIALSSWLPKELADSIPAQPGLENLPVFVAHGTQDTMIPIARAQESREILLKRGVALTYREYEMEHGIAPEALRDLVEWLDSKVLRPILIA